MYIFFISECAVFNFLSFFGGKFVNQFGFLFRFERDFGSQEDETRSFFFFFEIFCLGTCCRVLMRIADSG